MSSAYDVIVIGGGSPGEHCAGALAEGGLRVALVEHALVGGECSYWGCIHPKLCCALGKPCMGQTKRRRQRRSTSQRSLPGAITWFLVTPTLARSVGSLSRASSYFAVVAGWRGRA